MTKPIPARDIDTRLALADAETLRRLTVLLERVSVNETTGDLVLTAGKAKITLSEDGTIRLDGARIVQDADQDVAIKAAWIDLN